MKSRAAPLLPGRTENTAQTWSITIPPFSPLHQRHSRNRRERHEGEEPGIGAVSNKASSSPSFIPRRLPTGKDDIVGRLEPPSDANTKARLRWRSTAYPMANLI